MRQEYNQADQTTGFIGYAILILVFTGLFSVPSINRITGITRTEWLIVIGIHLTFDLFPYYAFKKLYRTPFYALCVNTLPLGLACLLVYFSGHVHSAFWAFFFVYVCVLGNAAQMNVYYAAAALAAPFLAGAAFHAHGYFPHPLSDWFEIGLTALLGLALYLYTGATNDKWRSLSLKKAELELVVATEQERHRIARELHDGIGSSFTSSLMMLDLVGKKTAAVDGCGRYVEGLKELLQEGLVNLRDLVWAEGAESSTIGDLASYIEQKLSRLSDGDGGIGIRTAMALENENLAIAPKAGLNLVRIVQEAVGNAIRHSKADRVEIAVQENAGTVRLTIRDNGRGFDPAQVRANGNGIGNMRKRCREMDADCRIHSEPGRGTEVSVAIALATASPRE